MGIRKDQSAYSVFLRILTEHPWLNQRRFSLLPNNYYYRQETIRRSLETGDVEKRKEGNRWRYRLTAQGYENVIRQNPKRYEKIVELAREDTGGLIERKVIRQSRLSDASFLFSCAGYGVHPDDKMNLQEVYEGLVHAEPSAYSASTPARLPPILEMDNLATHHYYTIPERKAVGAHLDATEYQKRTSLAGSFYSTNELRSLVFAVEKEGQFMDKTTNALQFSRISGTIFSPEGIYRVYNTETTAPKIRESGEEAYRLLLSRLGRNIYGSYLDKLYTERKLFAPDSYVMGTLLLGDANHKAADSVVKNSTYQSKGYGKKEDWRTENFRVSVMGETWYLPVIPEALPLLRIMQLPGWEPLIRLNCIRLIEGIEKENLTTGNQIGADAVDSYGIHYYCMIPLSLNRAIGIVKELQTTPNRIVIQTMPWQLPFWDRVFQRLNDNEVEKVELVEAPVDLLDVLWGKVYLNYFPKTGELLQHSILHPL